MRTVTREYKVFKFDELSEDVKEKVKDKIREMLVDSHFDFLEDDLLELLNHEYGLKNVKLQYDLGYSQGDGLSFELSDFLDLDYKNHCLKNENVFEKYLNENLNKDEMDMLYEYINECYKIKIVSHNSFYCYAETCYPDYEYFYGCNDDEDGYADKINNFIQYRVCELINEKYLEICHKLEEIGYSYYDVSDEEIEDYIEANGIEFTEDGEEF